VTILAPPAATPPCDADQRPRTTPTVLVSVPARHGRPPIEHYLVQDGDGPVIDVVAYNRERVSRAATEAWARRILGTTEFTHCTIPARVNLAKTCHYGNRWCRGGQGPHGECGSGWIEMPTPGFEHTNGILCAQIAAYGEDATQVEISFSGDGIDGCEVTSDQLRAIVADGRAHLDRLDRLADQFDALTGGAR
jgi:hypothetical protein